MSRRLTFVAEWYQEEAAIMRTFTVCFYLTDNAVEVFDQRTKKVFLRRTKIPELTERDFYVGSKITIFGRQFEIVDYGDVLTKNTLSKFRKKAFILLKNSLLDSFGKVLCSIIKSNFSINKAMMVSFTPVTVKQFLHQGNQQETAGTSVLINQLLAGPAIGLEIAGEDALEKFKICLGYAKASTSKTAPPDLVGLFDDDDVRNAIYCSQTDEDVEKDLQYFFDPRNSLLQPCILQNSTLALIKPHCIKEGNLGKIIFEIMDNGYKITTLRMLSLDRSNCEEFLEIYRGILPEYTPMVQQLASGVLMALEVVSCNPNKLTQYEFRQFCGPMDPEIAKQLRPHTLRAKFGKNKVMNAIHCTDLPDDTILELQYLFQIVDM